MLVIGANRLATFVGLRRLALGLILCDGQTASGGRCQWVLDAICQIVEWPSQLLRFDSVVLRTASWRNFQLAIIVLFGR